MPCGGIGWDLVGPVAAEGDGAVDAGGQTGVPEGVPLEPQLGARARPEGVWEGDWGGGSGDGRAVGSRNMALS